MRNLALHLVIALSPILAIAWPETQEEFDKAVQHNSPPQGQPGPAGNNAPQKLDPKAAKKQALAKFAKLAKKDIKVTEAQELLGVLEEGNKEEKALFEKLEEAASLGDEKKLGELEKELEGVIAKEALDTLYKAAQHQLAESASAKVMKNYKARVDPNTGLTKAERNFINQGFQKSEYAKDGFPLNDTYSVAARTRLKILGGKTDAASMKEAGVIASNLLSTVKPQDRVALAATATNPLLKAAANQWVNPSNASAANLTFLTAVQQQKTVTDARAAKFTALTQGYKNAKTEEERAKIQEELFKTWGQQSVRSFAEGHAARGQDPQFAQDAMRAAHGDNKKMNTVTYKGKSYELTEKQYQELQREVKKAVASGRVSESAAEQIQRIRESNTTIKSRAYTGQWKTEEVTLDVPLAAQNDNRPAREKSWNQISESRGIAKANKTEEEKAAEYKRWYDNRPKFAPVTEVNDAGSFQTHITSRHDDAKEQARRSGENASFDMVIGTVEGCPGCTKLQEGISQAANQFPRGAMTVYKAADRDTLMAAQQVLIAGQPAFKGNSIPYAVRVQVSPTGETTFHPLDKNTIISRDNRGRAELGTAYPNARQTLLQNAKR